MVAVDGPSAVISGGCRDGCARLLAWVTQTYGLGVSGCYNPNSTTSSGGPSYHVSGCATDHTADWFDADQRAAGDRLYDWAIANRESLQLQEAIWGERIWTSRRQSEGVRFYAPDDHKNHVHLAFSRHVADTWTPGPVAPPPDEDDMFTDADRQKLERIDVVVSATLKLVEHVDLMLVNFRAGFSKATETPYLKMSQVGRRIRDAVDKAVG
jgi:hypothetical protein